MSINKHQQIRLRVLDQCFRKRNGEFTFEKLIDACNEALGDVFDKKISVRTIREDIRFMRDTSGYNAPIVSEEWEGRKHIYYYSDPHYSIFKTELNDEDLETLKVAVNALSRLRGLPQFDFIQGSLSGLEDKFGIYGNEECVLGLEQNIDYLAVNYLPVLFDAIINKQVLAIHYRTFKGVDYNWVIHPYFIKQYNSRWFLFGRDNERQDQIINIPLDRIVEIEKTKVSYIKNDLVDFEDYFEDIIGVTKAPNQKEFDILLKFNPDRLPYILSKPIHGSMKIVDRAAGIVKIKVVPNKELESLIFSYGNHVEVLEPQWLRQQIADKVRELSNKYSGV